MQSLLQKCVCMDMIIFRSLYFKRKKMIGRRRGREKKEIDYPRVFFITKRKEEMSKRYISNTFPYDGIDSSL
jgi:hypothetical protein